MTAKPSVLGISPGTRLIGIALSRNGDLVDWRVKIFKGTWSNYKMRMILRAIKKILDREPVIIYIKVNRPGRDSAGTKALTTAIQKLANEKKINFKTFSLREILKLSFHDKGTLKQLWLGLKTYPEFVSTEGKVNEDKKRRLNKLSEAMALALLPPNKK